ncbi:hypothetical protein ABPG72_013709 [Tetrahymena utriculariae]
MASPRLRKEKESEECQLQELQSISQQQQTSAEQNKQKSQEEEGYSSKIVMIQEDTTYKNNIPNLRNVKRRQSSKDHHNLEENMGVLIEQNQIVTSLNQQEENDQARKSEENFQKEVSDLELQRQNTQKDNILSGKKFSCVYIKKYHNPKQQINCFYQRQSAKYERLVHCAKAEPKSDAPASPILLELFKY